MWGWLWSAHWRLRVQVLGEAGRAVEEDGLTVSFQNVAEHDSDEGGFGAIGQGQAGNFVEEGFDQAAEVGNHLPVFFFLGFHGISPWLGSQ